VGRWISFFFKKSKRSKYWRKRTRSYSKWYS